MYRLVVRIENFITRPFPSLFAKAKASQVVCKWNYSTFLLELFRLYRIGRWFLRIGFVRLPAFILRAMLLSVAMIYLSLFYVVRAIFLCVSHAVKRGVPLLKK